MKKTLLLLVLYLPATLCLYSQVSPGVIYYLKAAGGNDANNGLSWSSAFQTLQKALSKADYNDQVWVSSGTYYPDEGAGQTDNSRASSFHLKAGVAVYGGFSGTESSLTQRDWTKYVTILSGDLLKNDQTGFVNISDNAWHVVSASGTMDTTAKLDGFTIKGGNADSYPSNKGGGLYLYGASPLIAHCSFIQNTANFGGGVCNDQSSSPVLSGCSFTQNTAGADGGGLYNDNASSPTLTNCTFTSNKVYDEGGGIFNNHLSSPTIINSSFIQNKATSYGGALFNLNESSPKLVNCCFWKDSATQGGAVYNNMAYPEIINTTFVGNYASSGGCIANMNGRSILTNCILWGNSSTFYEIASYSTVTYSVVQGGNSGTGNLNINPQFKNIGTGDFHLLINSPARNKGNNAVVTLATDFDGKPRIRYGQVDMGAYEFQPGQAGSTLYVSLTGNDDNEGISWQTAYRTLQKAINTLVSGQIWVAAGTYYPDEGMGQTDHSRSSYFTLKPAVAMYGGFHGNETAVDQRNLKEDTTILSGEIQQDNIRSNNCYNVVCSNGAARTAVLDGFTITQGYGDADGAGMKNINSSPTIRNCLFKNNSTSQEGGGMYNNQSSPLIINCRFEGNYAGWRGGAMHFSCGTPTIINSIFYNNQSGGVGAAVSMEYLSIFTYPNTVTDCFPNPQFINCTFTRNSAPGNGGCIYGYDGRPAFANCILWNNGTMPYHDPWGGWLTISYSIFPGQSGTRMVEGDPLFVDAAHGDLRLLPGSPAIDTANDLGVPYYITTDIDGHPRKFGTHTDLGAYEFDTSKAQLPQRPPEPLSISCMDDYTITTGAQGCGAMVNIVETHPALVMGGKRPVTISYSPFSEGFLPVGTHTITVTATDSSGYSLSCSFLISVVDSTPPVITPPLAGVNTFIAHTDPDHCDYSVTGNGLNITASDNCGAPLSYYYMLVGATNSGELLSSATLSGVKLNKGITYIYYLVRDAAGNESTYELRAIVEDHTSPEITGVAVDKAVLYPPNHQMQDVSLRYNSTDNCGVVSTAVSVNSNEDVNITGAGNNSIDWQVVDEHHVKLRAERSGTATDRVYTINILATDAAGNTSSATTTVTVPHDKASVTRKARLAVSKEIAGLHISAAPNPFTNGFNLSVQSPSSQLLTIRVLDVEGRLIESRSGVSPKAVEYLGERYRPGVYYVQVMQGDEVQWIKLVKQ